MVRPGSENRPGPGGRRRQPGPDETTATERVLGQRIRAIYVMERSRYESVQRGHAVQWAIAKRYDGEVAADNDGRATPKAIWPRLARWMIASRVEPDDYIRFRFDAAGVGRAPEPPQLESAERLAEYRTMLCQNAEEHSAAQLEAQLSTLRTSVHALTRCGLKPQNALASALAHEASALSTLFRYGMASRAAADSGDAMFRRVADAYESQAAVDYVRKRDFYRKHWRRVLPLDFDRRAQRIYKLVLLNQESE